MRLRKKIKTAKKTGAALVLSAALCALFAVSVLAQAQTAVKVHAPAEPKASTETKTPPPPSIDSVKTEDIFFDFGQTKLNDFQKSNLERLALALAARQDIMLLIEGHSDDLGSRYRRQLRSEERAYLVRDFLVGQGVSANQIAAVGRSSNKPIADTSYYGRAQNRRASLTLIKDAPTTIAVPPRIADTVMVKDTIIIKDTVTIRDTIKIKEIIRDTITVIQPQ